MNKDNWTAHRYNGREWGIFCAASRCWVLFGSQKEMKRRAKELNAGL